MFRRKFICELTIRNAAANESKDHNEVGQSKSPTSVTNLDSCTSMIAVVTNYQIISDTDKTVEIITFTLDYKSTFQVAMMDNVTKCDDNQTGESCILKVRDALSVPTMGSNFVSPHVMKEAGINVRTTRISSSRRSLR